MESGTRLVANSNTNRFREGTMLSIAFQIIIDAGEDGIEIKDWKTQFEAKTSKKVPHWMLSFINGDLKHEVKIKKGRQKNAGVEKEQIEKDEKIEHKVKKKEKPMDQIQQLFFEELIATKEQMTILRQLQKNLFAAKKIKTTTGQIPRQHIEFANKTLAHLDKEQRKIILKLIRDKLETYDDYRFAAEAVAMLLPSEKCNNKIRVARV